MEENVLQDEEVLQVDESGTPVPVEVQEPLSVTIQEVDGQTIEYYALSSDLIGQGVFFLSLICGLVLFLCFARGLNS